MSAAEQGAATVPQMQGVDRRRSEPTIAPAVARRGILVPLQEKIVLTYRELQALGICAERTLRRLVGAGKVVRAIVRNGSRIKFEKAVLLEELRSSQG